MMAPDGLAQGLAQGLVRGLVGTLDRAWPKRATTPAALQFRPAPQAGALACWLALPQHPQPGAKPLVAVHGIRRGAREQASMFAARAEALGRVVIAPCFDGEQWPAYQRPGRQQRADLALLALLDSLQATGVVPTCDRFDLFGFSAGAQFAHRFAMLHPQRLGRLTLGSAGWYTFPDAAPYPYGLGETDLRAEPGASGCAVQMQRALDDFLRLPICVTVGERDNRVDPNTRSGPEIDRQQGRDRLARAGRWVRAVTMAARLRGIEAQVRLDVLPGVGHSFSRCIKRGGLAECVLPDERMALRPRATTSRFDLANTPLPRALPWAAPLNARALACSA